MSLEYLSVSKTEHKIRNLFRLIPHRLRCHFGIIKEKIKGFIQRNKLVYKEYVLDTKTGTIKIKLFNRKNRPKTGTWKQIEGKMVLVSFEGMVSPKEIIYGWKEVHNGMWDDTFQCHVKDKQHYRDLLKAHGLRQKEEYKYKPSYKTEWKKIAKEKTKKDLEKAYVKALKENPHAF